MQKCRFESDQVHSIKSYTDLNNRKQKRIPKAENAE